MADAMIDYLDRRYFYDHSYRDCDAEDLAAELQGEFPDATPEECLEAADGWLIDGPPPEPDDYDEQLEAELENDDEDPRP